MKRLLILALLLLPIPVFALDIPAPPDSAVLDQADIFTEGFEGELSQTLTDLETATSAEIGILTILSLGDEDLEGYANDVFRTWGIGQEESDNGLLILIAVEDRKARIEVGYGLEGRITDADSLYILDNVMLPPFKEGDYESGVRAAIEALSAEIYAEAGENGFLREENTVGDLYSVGSVVGIPIILFVLYFFWLTILNVLSRKRMERMRRFPLMPIAALGMLLTTSFEFVSWVFVLVFSMILHLSIVLPKVKKKHGKGPWSGGFFGGGGSSGGGFSSGGFSGGSSGGGGSSSSW